MSLGRKGAIILIVVILAGAGGYLAWRQSRPAISEREFATQLLGDFIRQTIRPKAVLVVGNPFSQLPNPSAQVRDFQRAGVAGLKTGLRNGPALTVDFPAVKPSVLANPASIPIDPKSPNPLSFLIESSAFDALLKSHPDCDLAVSLIGLPVNLGAMETWSKSGPPRFALLLPDWRILGDASEIAAAFSSGKLVAAVVSRSIAGTVADFRERYLLVNSNNVTELLQRSPQSFGL